MRKRSLLLLVGALAIVATLVVGPAATAGPRRSAGTLVLIHDQEPPNSAEQLGEQFASMRPCSFSTTSGTAARSGTARNLVLRSSHEQAQGIEVELADRSLPVQAERGLERWEAGHALISVPRGASGSTRSTT